MPKIEDDWSDSDDDDLASDVETAVQLGVPDGPIPPSSNDLLAANVSRIGGHPVWLLLSMFMYTYSSRLIYYILPNVLSV